MNNIILMCIVVVSLAVTALCVYAIIALVQITKTSKEMEESAKKINSELAIVNEISKKACMLSEKLSSPLVSAGSVALYLLKTFLKNKKDN
jgi:uncharacterized protein YoxC